MSPKKSPKNRANLPQEEPLKGISAVFFDAGNTLVEMNYAILAQAFDPLGVHCWTAKSVRKAEQSVRPTLDLYLNTGESTEKLQTFSYYMTLIGRSLGVAEKELDAIVPRIVEQNQKRNLWEVKTNNAEKVLGALLGAGLALGVISNSRGDIAGILKSLGLSHFFGFVLDSGIVGVEKPDTKMFEMAVELTGLEPSRCAYVGDLYSVDVQGAKAAGLRPFLLDPAGAWPELPCHKIKSIDDLSPSL